AQADIAGPDVAAFNFDITPVLATGADTNAETTPGRGTYGFQGDYSQLVVTDRAHLQTGPFSPIQEGINLLPPSGGTLILDFAATGVNAGDVDATGKAVVFSPGGDSTGQVIINGSLTLNDDDTLVIDVSGTPPFGADNVRVSGGLDLGNAQLV